MRTTKPAVLALEDGSVFRGVAFGADATIAGECVFNTSMTGYQEILTDPSYFGQIVTMTAAQIGNYGINDEDAEAAAPKASGFVVRELSPVVSNWRSTLSLGDYLARRGSFVGLDNYKPEYLPILSRDVLRRIASGDALWETMVPHEVGDLIKKRSFFGYHKTDEG